MTYLTLKNDRIRRRRARVLTFLITSALFAAGAYALGAQELLPALLEQYFGGEAAAGSVA